MMRLHELVSILVLVIVLSGCSLLVKEPQIELKEAGITGFTSSGIDVRILLDVTNPNSFDLELLDYTYDLSILNMPFLSGVSREAILFSSGTKTDLQLPLHLNYSDLLEIIKHQPDLDRLPYRMKGLLHVKGPLGELKIPVERAASLIIPEKYRPGAAFERLKNMLRSIR